MENTEFVGIDVSGAYLDVHVYPAGYTCWVNNNQCGMRELFTRLFEHQVALIVVEATGGLQRECAAFLASAGYEVSVASHAWSETLPGHLACWLKRTGLMPMSLPGLARRL